MNLPHVRRKRIRRRKYRREQNRLDRIEAAFSPNNVAYFYGLDLGYPTASEASYTSYARVSMRGPSSTGTGNMLLSAQDRFPNATLFVTYEKL